MNRATLLATILCGTPLTVCGCGEPTQSVCVRPDELTPQVAKQALLEMMRSDAGQALGFFDGTLVDDMSKVDVDKEQDGSYRWTGAYRFDPEKATYMLFVSMGQPSRPPLRPDPRGYLLNLRVYDGSFELKDGRWIATIPKYKYALLD